MLSTQWAVLNCGAVVETLIDSELFEAEAESNLWGRIDSIGREIQPLLAQEDYTGVLKSLAGLRDPVDRFFDDVMVMADDKAIRDNRLALLVGLQSLFLQVADISVLQSING